MQSMEGFLCSFAYPNPLELGQPDAAGMERAAPFLMHPFTLRGVVRHAGPSSPSSITSSEDVVSEWIIADLLLSGALDRPTSAGEAERSPPRAWIANANDITFVPDSKPGSMKSVNVTQPIPTPVIRERQREGSYMNDTAIDMGLVRYESSSGTGESMTPDMSPPSTPDTIVASPPSQLDKVFRLSQFRGGKGMHSPDSDESDSTGSTKHTAPTRTRSLNVLLGPKRLAGEQGIVKQGKGWNTKWKFWKVSFTTASA